MIYEAVLLALDGVIIDSVTDFWQDLATIHDVSLLA